MVGMHPEDFRPSSRHGSTRSNSENKIASAPIVGEYEEGARSV
jgi:hypothetical protein